MPQGAVPARWLLAHCLIDMALELEEPRIYAPGRCAEAVLGLKGLCRRSPHVAAGRNPPPVKRGMRQGVRQLLVAVFVVKTGRAALFWVCAGCALARSGARGPWQVLEPTP